MKKAVITVTVIGSVVADREVYLFGPRSVWIAEHVKDGIAQVHRAHPIVRPQSPFHDRNSHPSETRRGRVST
jgi:hypothetical protein